MKANYLKSNKTTTKQPNSYSIPGSRKARLIMSFILLNLISAPLFAQELYLDAENASIEKSPDGDIKDNGRTLIGANRGQNADRPFFSNNARKGSKSVGYQINPKGNNSSQRIETAIVHHSKRESISDGTEKYTGFSFQLDKNIWDNPKRWFVIHQIQQSESRSQTGNFPIIALHIEENTNNRLSLKSRRGKNGDINKITAVETEMDIVDIQKGIWYDVVVGWKFRPNNTDGWMAVWIKKATESDYKEYRKSNIKVGYSDPPKEVFQNKFGQYRGAQDTRNRLYFDEVRYATSFSKARIPGGSTPTPTPTPTPVPTPTNDDAPSVSFIKPINNQTLKEGSTVITQVKATDKDGISKVELYLDNKFIRQESADPYEWGHIANKDGSLKNLVKGTYKLKAVATDKKGKQTTKIITIKVGSTPINNSGILIQNGTYHMTATTSNQRLIARSQDNNNAQMNNPGNYNDQKWIFNHLGDNVYTIKNVSTNRYLEVPFAKCGRGENVATWIGAGSAHQKWKVISNGTAIYSLKPMHCQGFALDRAAGATNANIHIWRYNSSNVNQKWKITQTGSKTSDLTNNTTIDIKIAPNPAKDVVTISGIDKGDHIAIYNLLGSIVSQSIATQKKEIIAISTLPSGVYIISIAGKSNHQLIIN